MALIHPDDRRALEGQMGQLMQGDMESLAVEYRFRHADGRYRDVLDRAYILRGPDGKPLRVVGALQDITERKRAEQELRASEAKLRRSQEIAHLGSWTWDIILDKMEFSPEIVQLIGLGRPPSTMGEGFALVHPDDLPATRALVQAAVQEAKPYSHDVRIRLEDGSIRWLHTEGVPKVDGGRVVRLDGIVQDITERKAAEADLQRFRAVMDQSNDGLFLIDPATGRFLQTSGKATAEFGYTKEEMARLRVTDLDAAIPDDAAWQGLMATVRARGSLVGEGIGRRKDGTTFPIEFSTNYIGDREPPLLVAVVRNITERAAAQKDLREREALLNETQTFAHVGSWEIDLATGAQRGTPETRRLFGLAPDEKETQETILSHIHPDDRQATLETLRLAGERGGGEAETRVLLPGGAVRWLHSQMEVRRDSGGKPVRVVGISQDITERKRREAELARESRLVPFLQSITLAANEAGSAEEAFRIALEKICTFTGWSLGHVLFAEGGKAVSSAIWWPQDAARFPAFRSATGAMTFPPGVGLPGHVLLQRSAAWIRDVTADGNFPCAPEARDAGLHGAFAFPVFIGSDLVAVLEFFSSRIEEPDPNFLQAMANCGLQMGRVLERKRSALALERALRDAQAASEAKSRFLANMSHEIRTPLNAVIGMASLLGESQLPAEQREQVAVITKGGEHLLSVLNDILDLSRIEAGRLDVAVRPVAVATLLQEACRLVAADARERGLQLLSHAEAGAPAAVLADPVRARQVLLNLLSNAIKFTPQGYVEVTAVPAQGPGGRVDVEFAVHDTGIGIAEEQKGRLFQPFGQIDASATRSRGGAGLGLVISKRLVEAMGGRIWFESEPGKGSTFHATLPAAASGATVAAAVPAVPAVPARPRGFAAPLAILLAEDDQVNRTVALAMLRRLGQSADVATDGAQAVAAAMARRYDLVLMDVQMPVMDGLEAAQRIRASLGKDAPWIVAMTANAMAGDRERFLAGGADAYLAKPVRLEGLAEALLGCPAAKAA